jgi:hypothetical protein
VEELRTGHTQTGTGIAALVLGILSFIVLPLIGGVLALVLGYASKRTALRDTAASDDLGRVGRILGWINVLLVSAGLLLFLFTAQGFSRFPSSCEDELERIGGRDAVVGMFQCSDGQTEINIDRFDEQLPPIEVPLPPPEASS